MIEVETVITEHTKTERQVAKGEIEACCHRINFYYDIGDSELSDDDLQALEDEAEDRAKSMILEGCISGDLCCMVIHPDSDPEEIELHGSWSIINVSL